MFHSSESDAKRPPTEDKPTPADAQRPAAPNRAPGAQPNIVVYCTPWCPDCRSARQYLKQCGLTYTEIDITKDRTAEQHVRELCKGHVITPTFDIEGTIVRDFDRKKLDEALGRPSRS